MSLEKFLTLPNWASLGWLTYLISSMVFANPSYSAAHGNQTVRDQRVVKKTSDELDQLGLTLHGGNPLDPTSESLLGTYLQETGARAFVRAFPLYYNSAPGSDGPKRLFVSVTPDSFETFKSKFIHTNSLSHIHEPHQRVLSAGYLGSRGVMGRVSASFDFSYSGVLIFPILITNEESQRVLNFIELAGRTPASFDVTSAPWLLKNQDGASYCPIGNANSYSDWFIHLPIGSEQTIERVPYDRDTVYASANAANFPITDPTYFPLLQSVWSAPLGHTALYSLLGFDRLNLNNPGKIASALLGSATLRRLPVVFRFVNRHSDFEQNFDPWLSPQD